MAPIKRKTVDTLKNLALSVTLDSLVADIYITNLAKGELKSSLILQPLRLRDREDLLQINSQRLNILPGLLNDEVREKLISLFFTKPQWKIWADIHMDFLKVILNESVMKLDLGSGPLPYEVLSIIGDQCPQIASLNILLDEKLDDNPISIRDRYSESSSSINCKVVDETAPPLRKRLKRARSFNSLNNIESLILRGVSNTPLSKEVSSEQLNFKYLKEACILHGATNKILACLGQNSPCLEKLRVQFSLKVTDDGIKNLCLKVPENHSKKTGSLLDLRVRSFHLNPCCNTLKEVDTEGTCVTQFGIAFMLKHLPSLSSLGSCHFVSDALELLVGKKRIPASHAAAVSSVRKHSARYKLSRMKEQRVTWKKFLFLSCLCPEIKELTLGHSFKEVDLGGLQDDIGHKALRNQMGQLRYLNKLTLLKIGSNSVRETIEAVGHQLTHLHILCRGLELHSVLEACPNLVSLTLEGSRVSASYEALSSIKSEAVKKLEHLKVECHLPYSYINLLLCNPKQLRDIHLNDAGELTDAKIDALVKRGHFDSLTSLSIGRAVKLTSKAVLILLRKCPKLAKLHDIGGWNIAFEQYRKLLMEVERGNYDISFSCTPPLNLRDSESDESSVGSEYTMDLFDAFRNIFPVAIL